MVTPLLPVSSLLKPLPVTSLNLVPLMVMAGGLTITCSLELFMSLTPLLLPSPLYVASH